jgi:hypothetical protein
MKRSGAMRRWASACSFGGGLRQIFGVMFSCLAHDVSDVGATAKAQAPDGLASSFLVAAVGSADLRSHVSAVAHDVGCGCRRDGQGK